MTSISYGSNAERMQKALQHRSNRNCDTSTLSLAGISLSSNSSVPGLEKSPVTIRRHTSTASRRSSHPHIVGQENFRFSQSSRLSSVPSSGSATSLDSHSIFSGSEASSYTSRLQSSPRRLFEKSKAQDETPHIVLATPSEELLVGTRIERSNSRRAQEGARGQEQVYLPVSLQALDLDLDAVLSTAIATSVEGAEFAKPQALMTPLHLQERRPLGYYLPSLEQEMQALNSPTESTKSEGSSGRTSLRKFGSHVKRIARKMAV